MQSNTKFGLVMTVLFMLIVIGGCVEEGSIRSLPSTAEILFVSDRDTGSRRTEIYAMDADGGNVQTIYDGEGGIEVLGIWPEGNYDPSWSPDDQWIVFERATQYTEADLENFGSGIWHIFKVLRNGTDIMDLSQAGGHTDRAEYLPSYSPDGQFVVFGSIYEAADPAQGHSDIFRMDTNGGSLTRLTDNPASDMYPVWIPSSESFFNRILI